MSVSSSLVPANPPLSDVVFSCLGFKGNRFRYWTYFLLFFGAQGNGRCEWIFSPFGFRTLGVALEGQLRPGRRASFWFPFTPQDERASTVELWTSHPGIGRRILRERSISCRGMPNRKPQNPDPEPELELNLAENVSSGFWG